MMPVASCIPFPFSAPRNTMLTMLVCAIHWLSMQLYTLAYMSMHESCFLVCRPCFNTMKLWAFDPNIHLSLTDISFCSLSRLFTLLLVCSFACHAYHAYLLYASSYALCTSSFHCLSADFLFFPFACTHIERRHMELGHGLLGTSKKGAGVSMSIQPKRLCLVGLGVYFSHLVMYSFKPLSSSSLSLLDGLYQVYYAVYHSSLFLGYNDLFTFLHLYFGPYFRAVGIFFPVLCACIVHDICIYIPAHPFSIIVTVYVT